MRRVLRMLASGLLLGLAACLTALELVLAWAWLRGTLYVMRYGAAENPYAAEDADIAGLCALMLLPLLLVVLACMGYRIIWCRKRAKTRGER